MSSVETITWVIARAGGFTAYGLLSISVIVGLALSLHWQSALWPRLINSEMHNFAALLAVVFLTVHVLAVWVDPFTAFTMPDIFIPFASGYRTLWMGLGIVALYLGAAVGLSTWLRPRIGYRAWRAFHYVTLAIYALATLHGLFTGTDTHDWWALAVYGVSVSAVAILLVNRVRRASTKPAPTQLGRGASRLPMAHRERELASARQGS